MSNKFERTSNGGGQERYSSDFKDKVKTEFPDWAEMHKALDSGNESVGRYLDNSRVFFMQPKDIVKAIEDGKQDEVLKAAKRAQKIEELYTEWSNSSRK